MKDLFDTHISPMLIAENVAPFAAEEYVYEIKWDGERCVAFLDPDDGVRLENKRNVRMLPKVPELSGIHRQASKRCILHRHQHGPREQPQTRDTRMAFVGA